jgi:uncharacterized repeat protein (TIGR03803 family)
MRFHSLLFSAAVLAATSAASLPLLAQSANQSAAMRAAMQSSHASSHGGPSTGGDTSRVASGPAITNVHTFGSVTYDAASSVATLTQASDGKLYGISSSGGSHGQGAIYSLASNGTYTILYSFTGTNDSGASYGAGLVEGPDGYLYGATNGTLFKTKLGSNSVASIAAPGEILGTPVPDGNGNLYATAFLGGSAGNGELISYNIASGTLTDVHDFSYADGVGLEGSPILASDGNLYGTARYGGANASGSQYGDGTVWVYNPTTQVFHVVYNFNGASYGSYAPTGGLVQTANGNIYGTTNTGGQAFNPNNGNQYYYNVGTLFQIVPDGAASTVTIVHSFNPYLSEPINPYLGTPSTDASNNLYIAGSDGGASFDGGVSKITTAGASTLLHSFTTSEPYSTLSQPFLASDGNLYGATTAGGADSHGDLYQLTTSLTPVITLTTGSSTDTVGTAITLTWNTTNAFSNSMKVCFASSTDGTFTGSVSPSGSTRVAPTGSGSVTYAVTCGGVESATATVTVSQSCATADICLTALSHNFNGVAESTTARYTINLTNKTANAFPFAMALTGGSQFSTANNCGTSVAAGKTCTIAFTYAAPADAEFDSASFTIAADGQTFSPGNTGTLEGHSIVSGSVTLNTDQHNFGAVTEGTSQQFGLNVYNGSTVAVPLTFTPGGDTADYVVSSNNCPATLGVEQQCSIVFTYTPSTKGTYMTFTYAISTGASAVPVTPGNTLTLLGYGQ